MDKNVIFYLLMAKGEGGGGGASQWLHLHMHRAVRIQYNRKVYPSQLLSPLVNEKGSIRSAAHVWQIFKT